MRIFVKTVLAIIIFVLIAPQGLLASTVDIPKLISTSPNSRVPSLDIVGVNVFVSYQDLSEIPEIYFAKFSDEGLNFSDPLKISGEVEAKDVSYLSATGNNVYVIWPGSATPGEDTDGVYFTKSTDSGNIFSEPVNISGYAPGALNVNLESSGNFVYIAWAQEDSKIMFSLSNNEGVSFSPPVQLSTSLSVDPTVQSDEPFIAASGKDVYVAWVEERVMDEEPDRRLFVAHSTDFGETFSQATIVSNNSEPDKPSMVINKRGDEIFIVWREDKLDLQQTRSIDFAKSEDSGLNFSTPVSVATGGFDIDDPFLAINNRGDLNFVWRELEDIFFSRSLDEGNTLSTSENISNDVSFSSTPTLRVNNMGRGFVAWSDTDLTTDTNSILFTTVTP